MCTLIMLYKVMDEFLVIAMENRDEYAYKEEQPPVYFDEDPFHSFKTYAALDSGTKGTWLAFNRKGMFVALTERCSSKPADKLTKSIGRLCLEVARTYGNAEDAKDFFEEELEEGGYHKVNFVVADKDNAYMTYYDSKVGTRKIDEGIHIFVNDYLTTCPETFIQKHDRVDSMLRKDRAEMLLKDFKPRRIDDAIEKLKELARDHYDDVVPKEFTLCNHHSDEFYTRSSSIVAINKEFEKSTYLYCPGRPCEEEYEDYSHLFNEVKAHV
ncbi:MAG: NRDE family protein [Candidatus Aenigmatarchaeota archaeon]